MTYQFAEGSSFAYGKRQRLREAGLWFVDGDEYYAGKYLSVSTRGATLPPISIAPDADSRTALDVLTWQLRKSGDWLALGRPTLAEISCYPYVKRAPEGNVPLEPWPEVRDWLARCEAIPGWIPIDP